MNYDQGDLCVRVLSCVAWADGKLSVEELSSVVDLVDRLDYIDRSKIQDIFMTPVRFTFLDKIAALPRGARVRLIHDSYVLADYCGGASEPELEIIQAIAGTIIAPEKWPEALGSLEAWVAYERKARKVWGWTHLAD